MCPVAMDCGIPLFPKESIQFVHPGSAQPQYLVSATLRTLAFIYLQNEAGYVVRLHDNNYLQEKVDLRFPYNYPTSYQQKELTETQRKDVFKLDVKTVLDWKADQTDGK